MALAQTMPYIHAVNSLRQGDIYASLMWFIIGSGNGLLPVQCQAITWTSNDLLSMGPLETMFSEILYRNHKIFNDKIAFEYVICQSGDHLVSASMC